MAPERQKNFILPAQVATSGDLSRLIRELTSVDDFLSQASIRNSKESSQLPQISKLLEEMANDQGLSLLKASDRKNFIAMLNFIKQNSPVIHFSFANTPSLSFINKLVTWLRANIHPYLLVRVGLQPAIAGGCIVRTTNKQFDLSFRKHFNAQHDLLVKQLSGVKESVSHE